MTKISEPDSNEVAKKFDNAIGPIPYGMTNDYMFRIVLQQSKPALKGLISSVLRMDEDDIEDLTVLNPVDPGKSVSDKEIRMDVVVSLKDGRKIDLEMQIKNYGDWPERSMLYLCREYDALSSGESYEAINSVFQIGFLDFTLFQDRPEFCGRYQLRNEKDNYLYSSKLNLFVIQLNSTDIATEEDKKFGIDKWVRFFKAKTWEELKMIAQDKESMLSAAKSMFLSNEDYNIRKVCTEREEHERYIEHLKNKATILESELKSAKSELNTAKIQNDVLMKLLKDNGIEIPDDTGHKN